MRTRNLGLGTAALVAMWGTPALAVNTEDYRIPYFGAAYEYLQTDTQRDSDAGAGFQLTFGVPLDDSMQAIELRFFDAGMARHIDDKKDYQSGLFIDYVRDFGPIGQGGDLLSGIKPFVSAGVGFLQEDVRADKHLHLGLAAGGGVLFPIGWNGWAVRFDARLQPQSNSESVPNESMLLDYVVNLGIQIPMTIFFDRPVDVSPAQDCPLAVVDPATGRRDCSTDSDGDGVGDAVDACPGTPTGQAVDKKGCAKGKEITDDDKDGVPNGSDKCPGTQEGLKVDDKGCVVAQKTAIAGVTFQENSAKLTPEGRATLDGVAETLSQQKDLKVEIAGHTDNVGSEAYNTLLSQQRAEAVRNYLVEKGIDGDRMTAAGYGESEPVGSNDTDEGRKANRRVEFRISTSE